MRKRTIAEKNASAVRDLKDGNARSVTDKDGKRRIVKMAPNTDRKPVRRSFIGNRIFYNCPKCGKTLEFSKKTHKNLCMRCGQYLDWSEFEKPLSIYIQAEDAEDAAYWAGLYAYYNGTSYAIDTDQWRLAKKEYPVLWYFVFEENTEYGRFMREAAKDGKILREIK